MAKTTGTGSKGVTKDALHNKGKDAPIVKMGQTTGNRHGAGPVGKGVKGK